MKLIPLANNMTELVLPKTDHRCGFRVLFSYQTPVAAEDDRGNYYMTDHKWSQTTSRHINKWLGDAKLGAASKPQWFFDKLVA